MLDKVQLDKVLFIDIETAPLFDRYSALTEEEKQFYSVKVPPVNEEQSDDERYQRAGLFAEFGRIVCISIAYIRDTRIGKEIRLKSFYHSDEEVILKDFSSLLESHFSSPYHVICGHNIKGFDIPFICRRLMIHRLPIPAIINVIGKKPWEINHLDTMEIWKFGDFRSSASLALLCSVFGIKTPKEDISGADVAEVFHRDNDLPRIKRYCENDVVATVQLFLAMKGDNLVDEGSIYRSED